MTFLCIWFRAFVDLQDLCVTHHLLNRVFLHVSGASHDLDRIGSDLHAEIGGKALAMAETLETSLAPLSAYRADRVESVRGPPRSTSPCRQAYAELPGN